MSTSKFLGTRQLLGSMTRNSSSKKLSAAYRVVDAKRVSAATRNGVEEVESPVTQPTKFKIGKFGQARNKKALKNVKELSVYELLTLTDEMASKEGRKIIRNYEDLLELVKKREQNAK
ncbi:uncharacterized protein Dwil_GK27996 [Drosophila willistoni]|uniref:Uncharacterized protein n=1 Tax=Drosophila willistoni TaxID=7260 RepID=A0A0Q9X2A1_DROWI|nr:uncharacterized protein LOC6644510 isoform X2 [Drosophila willistoni]KRF98891.1 uncharacterized protein Dwil_GK27996 [Drosophila willistoni]